MIWPSPASGAAGLASAMEQINGSGMLDEDKWPGRRARREDGRCHLALLF